MNRRKRQSISLQVSLVSLAPHLKPEAKDVSYENNKSNSACVLYMNLQNTI